MKVLKGLGIALAVLVMLLIIAVLALVLLLDPDIFKPRIEAIAREHNVALNIKGDLDWQFWPALAIEINDVDAATIDDQPLAKFNRASLRVAVTPLFRREVAVEHVLLEGAVIDLTVDENGRGNWEALTATDTDATTPSAPARPAEEPEQPAETTAPEGEGAQLQLAVDRISLRNSALNYTSQATSEGGGQRLAARGINLEIDGFNLQAQPFSMTLQWQSELSDEAMFGDQPVTIVGDMAQQVQLGSDMNRVDVTDGQLALTVADVPVQLTYSVSLRDLQEQLRYLGEFNLAPVNVKQLLTALGQEAPATSADYALTQVSLAANFSGDTSAVALEPFVLTLDNTRLSGRVAITDFSTSALQLSLKGDSLNADDYLPPPTEEAAPEPAATGDEVIIPVDTLKALNADVAVDFGQLTVSTIPLQQVQLRLNADAGLITLERLNANLYGGNLSASGNLDARGDTAALDFQGEVASLQLAPFLEGRELTEKIQLSGAIDASAQGQAQGVTMNQLMSSGKGQATFSGAQVRLAPLNVEEKFCQIVHLVNKMPANQQDWPDYTEMTQLNGKVSYASQVLSVDEFTAGVSQLLLGVDGKLDLGEGDYNLGLPLMLTESQTSPNGCQVQSNYWLNRSLGLLRCKGSLEGLNPVDDCRPDAEGLTDLVRDYAEYQLRERHGDKIDAAEQKLEEKKDELRQKLQEELGTEEGKKVEDRLRQLFGR